MWVQQSNKTNGMVGKRGPRAFQNWRGWLNRTSTAEFTTILKRGNNKNYQEIQPRLDSIVGLGVGINVSLSRERCRGGGTIGSMVRLKRGSRAFQNFRGLLNRTGTAKVTVRTESCINVSSSFSLSWKGVFIFPSK